MVPILTTLVLLTKLGWSLPLVDPGLFVISGVSTCGMGAGYCLLGADCSLNQDFVSDPGGHCNGLKGAFTPSAHFVCCTSPQATNELHTTSTKADKEPVLTTTGQAVDEAEATTVQQTTTVQLATTVQQTITSPPDYIEIDQESSEDESVNRVDWEGAKNYTDFGDFCRPCSTQTVFSLDSTPLCLGTHLRHGWVLTSGSCALRIFRSGMIKIVGKYQQDPELETFVKTIAVHEDYRPYTSNILHPEPNNIGLILLSSEPRNACSPCIPDSEDKFAGKLCSTIVNSTALFVKLNKKDSLAAEDVCESVVETMQGEGTEDFYTVACETNSNSRYNTEDDTESGKGLMCRGYIAGIETGSGTGLAVFTRVSQFSEWITANMMQQQRQTFDTLAH